MKMSLRILGILLVGLVSISMSDCPNETGTSNGGTGTSSDGTSTNIRGSYGLVSRGNTTPKDGVGGMMLILKNGWKAQIYNSDAPNSGYLVVSGSKYDSEYLYYNKVRFSDPEVFARPISLKGAIPYTFSGDTMRFNFAVDYVWKKK